MASAKVKRARKQLVQQGLFRRGGKRRGAGRKPKGPRAGQRHEARPEFKPSHGLHVVMRVAPAVGSLRRRTLCKAVRDATLFPDWSELQDRIWMWPIRATCDPLVVFRPRAWLLSEGWKLAGSVRARDLPGAHRHARRAPRIGCSSAATEARGRLRHASVRGERGMYMATRGV